MGAEASVRLYHPDQALARALIAQGVAEVRRLERIFSLHDDRSALAELNRTGVLVAPPADLLTLLQAALDAHELTAGAFDPSVQPLWALYHGHFSHPGAAPGGPAPALVERALQRVGLRHVAFDRNRVVFKQPGMQLTFNGIAQGYATDRVVAILRAAGITSSLVDMGEPRALGPPPSGQPWRIGIADPEEPDGISETLEVRDGAVATSGGYGFRFDADGRFNHLLDPRTGLSASLYRSVTVQRPTATEADALSTAFSLMEPDRVQGVIRALRGGQARLVSASGERQILTT